MSYKNDKGFLLLVAENLKTFEGWDSRKYKDSTGHWTIGYGHNLDADKLKARIPHTISKAGWGSKLLIEDVKEAVQSCYELFPHLDTFNQSVAHGCVHLMFNMGVGTLRKFTTTVPAINRGDYEMVKRNLRKSKWYKQVHPRRGDFVRALFNRDV